jgi:hypothetical protein
MEATTESKKKRTTVKVDPKATEKEAKTEEKGKEKKVKEPKTPAQYLADYIEKKDSCAAEVTKQMIKGATLDQLVATATTFNMKQDKGHKWGQKTGELRSHFRWLEAEPRNLKVTEEDGKFYVKAE